MDVDPWSLYVIYGSVHRNIHVPWSPSRQVSQGCRKSAGSRNCHTSWEGIPCVPRLRTDEIDHIHLGVIPRFVLLSSIISPDRPAGLGVLSNRQGLHTSMTRRRTAQSRAALSTLMLPAMGNPGAYFVHCHSTEQPISAHASRHKGLRSKCHLGAKHGYLESTLF